MLIHYLLFFAASVAGSTESPLVLPPLEGGTKVGIALFAEESFSLEAYRVPLSAIQQRVLQANISLAVVVGRVVDDVDESVHAASTLYRVPTWYAGGHSSDGSEVAQEYAVAPSKNGNTYEGLVLIAGFLSRSQRPDIRQCLSKASIKPVRSFKCPLGCLKDGAHRCDGSNEVNYSLPVLTVAGELDGIVRITRIAEAFHTQINLSKRKSDAFAIVPGLNHGLFFNQSSTQLERDLVAETTFDVAIATIADNIATFVAQSSTSYTNQEASQFFEPIIAVFVEQEGNWFFTGADEEHGSSPWAAAAQQRLASPLPLNAEKWESATNEFRLMSDEDKIPPYFRPKHRASVNFNDSQWESNTISQLRFIEVSVTQAGAGLNGYAIIEEEKLGVMQKRADDGADYTSAIEIATKMVSRQKVFSESSNPSPDNLDGKNQCQAINQKAYDFALSSIKGTSALARYQQKGIKMVMVEDKKPTPAIGPFWIWSYLTSTLTKDTPPVLQVQSFYAFYSLSSNPYGAGNHYCKLLSPARVLEWVYVDSVRPS